MKAPQHPGMVSGKVDKLWNEVMGEVPQVQPQNRFEVVHCPQAIPSLSDLDGRCSISRLLDRLIWKQHDRCSSSLDGRDIGSHIDNFELDDVL